VKLTSSRNLLFVRGSAPALETAVRAVSIAGRDLSRPARPGGAAGGEVGDRG
jgi:hypothetical protein